MKNRNFACIWIINGALVASAALLPAGAHAQSKALVVEEIIARVNNDVVTLSDYQKAEEQLREEVAHDCQGCPQDKLLAEYKDQQKDLLRGLIDQSLMVQRAKDMGISVEIGRDQAAGRRAQAEQPREPGGFGKGRGKLGPGLGRL